MAYFFDFVVECLPGNSQLVGCCTEIPIMFLNGMVDHSSFHILKSQIRFALFGRRQGPHEKIFGFKEIPFAQDDRFLNGMLQFAYISGP